MLEVNIFPQNLWITLWIKPVEGKEVPKTAVLLQVDQNLINLFPLLISVLHIL